MERILCCIDTDPASAATLAWMRRLWPEARMSAVHVAPPEPVLLGGMSEWEIDRDDPFGPPRRWLAGLAQQHGADPELLSGEAWPAIRDHIDGLSPAPDLVVAAAHTGRLARIALGSTAGELAQNCPLDTLIVPPHAADGGRPVDDIVCAVDEPQALVATAGAQRLARACGATRIEVVHVAGPPTVVGRDLIAETLPMPAGVELEARALLERAQASIPGATASLLAGDPASRLVDHCVSTGAGALVLAPGPRGFGSVASQAIRSAPCAVMLARPTA